jgi:hypothetical protein
MDASSNSGESEADLQFPILEPGPAREIPAPPGSADQVIDQVIALSEAFLPFATGRPDFEAWRLEMKTRIPFRLMPPSDPSG